jgi:hypothetical protein
MGCRTYGMWELWDIFKLLFPLSVLWDIGLMGYRTYGISDLWGVGLVMCRTYGGTPILQSYIDYVALT